MVELLVALVGEELQPVVLFEVVLEFLEEPLIEQLWYQRMSGEVTMVLQLLKLE